MSALTASQRELATLHGIAVEYVDWWGETVPVPVDTVIAVLASLGVSAETPAAAESALHAYLRRKSTEALPPCVVTRQGRRDEIVLRHPPGAAVEVWVELEAGGRIDIEAATATA